MGQRAGVDAGDGGRLLAFSQASKCWVARQFEGSVMSRLRMAPRAATRRGFDIFRIGADIADMREGEGDDLTGIGGIGHDLLIAGHRGVEADLAHRLALGAQASALQHGPIGKNDERGGNRGCIICGRVWGFGRGGHARAFAVEDVERGRANLGSRLRARESASRKLGVSIP